MNDIRRTILWVVFSMSLLLLWDAWQRHQGQTGFFGAPASPAASAAAPAGAVPAASAAVDSSVPAPTMANASGTSAPVPAGTEASTTAASELISVRTDVYDMVFDTQGGTLRRLELLGVKDHNDRTRNVVLFDQSAERLYLAQTGLVAAGGLAVPNHQTVMTALPGARELADGQDQLVLSFESPASSGVQLRKTYTFERGSHVIAVRHEVINQGTAPVQPQLYQQLVRDGNPPAGESKLYFTFTGPAVYNEASKFRKVEFSDIEKARPGDKPSYEAQADNGWVAMVQHYFASAWLLGADAQDAAKPVSREFFTRKVAGNQYAVGMLQGLGEVAPGATLTVHSRLFAGPQEEYKLAELAPGLDLVKDYGWFTILAKPLFWLLTQLHELIGNWGWAIVALVFVLKAAFYWLNASAYRSMGKMKAINPRIMELRERLKDKPQQMQQEMMRIYREEKVNPIGGCLPILLQMPFFIALYWVLLSSVEMRNAPWMGWITDLSALDPYYVLPLIMTATSLFQVWLNPTPPDPVQAKMMWLMPLIFSVMFFFFPAGLVLYWLTNNILSIAQQYLINKQLGVLGK